jgi:DNA-binding transcriptional LysR family regulator
MDLHLFKTLIAVAKNKSVTKASEEVYLTQPAVTKQIRSLEEIYGIKLFKRKNRQFVITQEGDALLQYAYRLVNTYEESISAINERKGKIIGTLRMGANLTLGIYVLPRLIKLFRDNYPDLKIEMILDNTDHIIRAVKRNDVNFGFIGIRVNDPLITNHLFYQGEMVTVAGPTMGISGKTVSWQMLKSLPYIVRERGSDIRDTCEDWLRMKAIDLKPVMELNSTEALKSCVHYGIGFSFLPWCTVHQEVSAGLLNMLLVPYFKVTQDYFICHYYGKRFSKPEEAFLEFLFSEIESKGVIHPFPIRSL